jgi:signal transduction histidine kinase
MNANAPVITNASVLQGWRPLPWNSRLRGWFSGFSYAAAVALAQWSSHALMAFLFLQSTPSINSIGTLDALGLSAWWVAAAVVPNMVLFLLALHLAPAAGFKRLLWFGATVALMAAWCMSSGVLAGDPIHLAEYPLDLFEDALVAAAVAYPCWARAMESTLAQKTVAGETLETEVKQAQLQQLRAQIEPHFLFNTLATVRTLARNDRAAAVRMLDHLLRYFAEALPKLQRDDTSLAEELELIDAYLRIHQIRLGDRLDYKLEAPAELAAARLPTMMLLTLVENAVKHGINPAIEGGAIRVSASCESSMLTVKVADTGRGMSAQQGHGSGLANVRQRLTLLFGATGSLSLSRAEPRGVIASLSVPLRA